jgi:hypothetical protein
MTRKISPEIVQQAVKLRAAGKTYMEVSKELNIGITWCKTNLNKVSVRTEERISELESKSRTRKGLSKGEIAKTLDSNQSKEQLKKDVQKMTQRIRKRNKENIVRPNWMVPEFARYVTNRIIEDSMAQEQRMHEQATELRTLLLDAYESEDEQKEVPSVQALKSAIATLTYTMTNQSSAAGSILSSWLESLYNTAVKLEHRNHTKEISIKVVPFVLPSELQDIGEFAY